MFLFLDTDVIKIVRTQYSDEVVEPCCHLTVMGDLRLRLRLRPR